MQASPPDSPRDPSAPPPEKPIIVPADAPPVAHLDTKARLLLLAVMLLIAAAAAYVLYARGKTRAVVVRSKMECGTA